LENTVNPEWPQVTIWAMRIASRINKATDNTLRICNTHTYYSYMAKNITQNVTFLRISSALVLWDTVRNIFKYNLGRMWNFWKPKLKVHTVKA